MNIVYLHVHLIQPFTSSRLILGPRGHAPFGQHQELRQKSDLRPEVVTLGSGQKDCGLWGCELQYAMN